MPEAVPTGSGPLTGRRVGVLMETDYVEPEIAYYQRRFAEEGAEVVFLTRLWGQDRITFTGHEHRAPFTVDGDLEAVDDAALRSYSALLVPSGMVSDRLRYPTDVHRLAPAVDLVRRAFALPGLLKGFVCHGLWLVSAVPQTVRGRALTCHPNLVGDVRNMGAHYVGGDVVVDHDLVTARTVDHCHLFAKKLIQLMTERGPA